MAYREAILADSPAGYYRLDEASGATFADSSGNGHSLTFSNASGFSYSQAGLLTGDLNTAIKKGDVTTSFTGTVVSPPSSIVGGFSLEGWFNCSALPGGGYSQSGYFIHITAGSYTWDVQLYSSSSGAALQIRTSFNRVDAYIAGVVVPATRYYIAIVFNNIHLDVYLNNTRYQHIARTDNYSGAVSVFNLLGFASKFTNTTLDEFAYYTRALTTDEMTEHYGYGNGSLIDCRGDCRPILRPRFNPTAQSIHRLGL